MSFDLQAKARQIRHLWTGDRALRDRLARGGAGALAVHVGAAGLALAVQIGLTRLLGVERYGIYVYAVSWLTVLALVARLGQDTVLVRFVAVFRADGEWGRMRGLLASSTRLAAAAALALAAAGTAAVWLLGSRLDRDLVPALLVAAAGLPVAALLSLRQGALRGLGRVVRAQLPEMIVAPLAVLAGVALLERLRGEVDGWQAVAAHVAAVALALAVAGWWLRRALPREVGDRPVERGEARRWLATGAPLLLVSAMAIVLAKTDVLMLGAWIGTTEAGAYAAAAKLARLVTFGLAAATMIAAPLIAAAHARRDRTALQRIASLAAAGIVLFTAPVATGVVVLRELLLSLFDPTFVAASGALVLLTGGHVVNALAGPVSFFLTMTGNQVAVARVTVAAAALNVALNALLIPRYGLAGAAAATALSIAAMNVALALVVRRRLGIRPTLLGLLTPHGGNR